MIGIKHLTGVNFQKHLLARRYKKNKIKRVIVAGLMLTSMVDMFSLLVIFLLQSFSSSPEVMAMSKGVVLPAAMMGMASKDAPVISISKEEVLLDQKPVGKPGELLTKPEPILAQLQSLKTIWVKAHPTEKFSGDIHLQADKELSSVVVSQVMNLLVSQGYNAIHLAVVSGQAK